MSVIPPNITGGFCRLQPWGMRNDYRFWVVMASFAHRYKSSLIYQISNSQPDPKLSWVTEYLQLKVLLYLAQRGVPCRMS
jgi:hypothetical protein